MSEKSLFDSRQGQDFFSPKHQKQLWDTSSLLFNGTGGIFPFSPGLQQPRRESDHSPHLVSGLNTHFAILLLPYASSWHENKQLCKFTSCPLSKTKQGAILSLSYLNTNASFVLKWRINVAVETKSNQQSVTINYISFLHELITKRLYGRIPKKSIFEYFRSPVKKIQVSLKSYNYNTYCTWRPMYIYDNISLTSS